MPHFALSVVQKLANSAKKRQPRTNDATSTGTGKGDHGAHLGSAFASPLTKLAGSWRAGCGRTRSSRRLCFLGLAGATISVERAPAATISVEREPAAPSPSGAAPPGSARWGRGAGSAGGGGGRSAAPPSSTRKASPARRTSGMRTRRSDLIGCGACLGLVRRGEVGSGSGRSLDSARGLLGDEGDGGDGRRLLEAGCDLLFRFAVESQSDGFRSTR